MEIAIFDRGLLYCLRLPEQFDQVASSSTKDEDVTGEWISFQHCLYRRAQSGKITPQVRNPAAIQICVPVGNASQQALQRSAHALRIGDTFAAHPSMAKVDIDDAWSCGFGLPGVQNLLNARGVVPLILRIVRVNAVVSMKPQPNATSVMGRLEFRKSTTARLMRLLSIQYLKMTPVLR